MLRQLRVGNLALAADVVVGLEPGLTMLTGETGAGKSLIAGALALLAGGKADRDLIRRGEDTAFVEGVFDLGPRPTLRAEAVAAGLALGADHVLVLRRELRREGRGRVLINGLVSSLALLEQFGGRLLAVQSQDQQRELTRPHFATDYLDAALGLEELRAGVDAALRHCRELESRLAARRQEVEFARQQLEMWEYQHRELGTAGLSVDEEATLREQLALGRDARGLLEAAAAARLELTEGEVNAAGLLGAARGRLGPAAAASPRLADLAGLLDAAQEQVVEAARGLERFLDGVEVDPARLDELEARQSLYAELQRKYDRDVAGLAQLEAELADRIDRQRASADHLLELEDACAVAREELVAVCAELRRRRGAGARQIASRAEELIRPLALPELDLEFRVEPDRDPAGPEVAGEPCRVTARGADVVTLLARTNPGEDAGEVARIASGGERSRIHLGLAVLRLGGAPETPSWLFDEIDAGLGMDHAVAVARLLGTLAQGQQVLCITHLPTVAACGARHLAVSKRVSDGRTSVEVREVTGEDRVAELARLLGGEQAGQAEGQLEYARELLRTPSAQAGTA